MPVTAPIAVEADHLSLSYGRHVVLDAVSFAIPEGSYVGIVGPNGGGKTTLLKILLGIVKPGSGSVTMFGQSPSQARKGGKVGYVPQRITQTEFPFPATVEEIVRSGRTPGIGIGRPFSPADARLVDRAMETSGVFHLRDRLVGNLSGGERQKTFIARALAAEPRLLILDEPTTGVDVQSREEFHALLRRLNTDLGLTILFVSHDVDVMKNEVSFVLALNQKLLCHCSSHDFLSSETLQKLYGGHDELLHPHHH